MVMLLSQITFLQWFVGLGSFSLLLTLKRSLKAWSYLRISGAQARGIPEKKPQNMRIFLFLLSVVVAVRVSIPERISVGERISVPKGTVSHRWQLIGVGTTAAVARPPYMPETSVLMDYRR
jgi:hypothetical protein